MRIKVSCYVCDKLLPHDAKEYFECCRKYRSEQIERLREYEGMLHLRKKDR